MNKTNTVTLMLGVLSAFFLATTVGAYVFMDAAVTEQTENNKLLSYQIEELRKTNDKMTAQVSSLQATQEEYTAFRENVGSYFTLSESINKDLDKLSKTYVSFTKDYNHASSQSKLVEFETKFAELQAHGEEWKTLLESNKEDFIALGINVESELESMTETLPKVEKSLTDMRAHMNA